MNENNEKNTNKGLTILIVILILIIIGLTGYIVYDKLNETDDKDKIPEVTKPNISREEKIEARDLTSEELNYFKEYFNKIGINGFLTQEFNDIKDIDLFILFYNGIGKQETLTDEEQNEILKINGLEEMYTEVKKISDDDIKDFLKVNAGLNHVKGSTIKNFTYLSKYDAYYNMHGDTSFIEVDSCTSGRIDENGNYILNCKFNDNIYDNMQTETTLKKSGNNYIFISNKCIGDCESLPGNVKY